ncbi:MAG: 3-methyl-2-oxobutanoate hydroxymethyltransferase, partial [Aquiluna sp.]
ITSKLSIPTIGIGAGPDTDGQILVWMDFAGLGNRNPSFSKQYANLRQILSDAAKEYRSEVRSGSFPEAEKNFS